MNKLLEQTTPYIPKKSLFGKPKTAEENAKAEIEEIHHKLLHYQNELALVTKRVEYLEERKQQLQTQLQNNYFSTASARLSIDPAAFAKK